MSKTVMITGANRGLGLGYAQGFASRNWRVLACCRQPDQAEALTQLQAAQGATVSTHALDVTDHAAVDALAHELRDVSLDLLINNAGTFGPLPAMEGMSYQTLEAMDYGIWRDMLELNVLGVFKMTSAFLPALTAGGGGAIINLSSDLGSIANNRFGSSHAYRSSKVAVNMLTKGWALELADRNVVVISMAPGWVRTDLGGEKADLNVADTMAAQFQWITDLKAEHSGRFLDRNGEDVAW